VNFRTCFPDALIVKLETFSNLNKSANGSYTTNQLTFDLSAYRSQCILLQFYADNDFSNITIFRIDDLTLTVDLVAAPSTPAGFAASSNSTQITLTWNDVSGESDYELQRAPSSSGPWTQLGLVGQNGTSYQDNGATAGVLYWYQVRARSAVGNSGWSAAISSSLDRTPTVTTEAASSVGSTSATVNSLVNPRGVSTVAYFQYGTTTSYGSVSLVSSAMIGTGNQSFNRAISGLSPNTLYHARVVATNTLGQLGQGNDITFTTSSASEPPVARISGEQFPVLGSLHCYDGQGSTGTGLSYSWSTSDGQSASGSKPCFSFNFAGQKIIHLTVTDSSGRTSSTLKTINAQSANNGTGPGQSTGADPVVLSSGNYISEHVDLRLAGKGFPFEFKRFYNSKFSDQSGRPLGFGWTHSYNEFLRDTGTNALITRGDGSTWALFPTNGGYVGRDGIFDSLTRNPDSTWSLVDKAQTTRLFGSNGVLLSITDKNSNTLSLQYLGSTLSQIIDTAGRAIFFQTNTDGLISEIADPIGRHVQFEYQNTNLVRIIDPRGHTNRFEYNEAHQIANAFDARGTLYLHNEYNPTNFTVSRQHDALTNWTYFTYDFDNRITYQTNASGKFSMHQFDHRLLVTNIVDEAGHTNSFAYDDDRNQIYVRDKNGNETRYAYDNRGNVTNKTNAMGQTTFIEYDSLNNPARRVDALSKVTAFGYDARGNLISTTNAEGHVSGVAYDANGLPTLLLDARGFSTTNQYDAQGNLTAVIDAAGFTNRAEYDSVGRKTRQIDANNQPNSIAYDGNDNPIFTVNALGFTNAFLYDENNNRVFSLDPRRVGNTNVFDLKDRLVAVVGALNSFASNRYDSLDRKIEGFDARRNSTRFSYDDIGNIIATTNALGETVRFFHDPSGNQIAVTDPADNSVSNVFDSLNRKVLSIDALGLTNATGYDAVGRVVATTNANNLVTQFTYDSIGRLTNILDSANQRVSFGYDENGNRTHITGPNGHTWTNVFDALNRVIEQRNPDGTRTLFRYDPVGNLTNKITPNGDSISYRYDALNRRTQIIYPAGSPVLFAYDAVGNQTNMTDALGTTSSRYDDLNRLTSVTDPFGQTVQYGYDANGNRISLTCTVTNTVRYGFDALNRMVALTNWLGGETTYAYDNRGNLVAITNANGTIAFQSHDAAERLVGLTNARPGGSAIAAYALTLDAVGNHLQSVQHQPLFPILPSRTNTYSYNSDNRLTLLDGQPVAHDLNGNLKAIGTNTTFNYDLEDRLVQSSVTNALGASAYDGLGHRLSRTVNGQSARFVLDRAGALTQVLLETETNGSPIAFYVYGLGLAQRITPDGAVATYHFDTQGSVVALTDSAGNVTDAYAYDSFGVPANTQGASPQPFRYLGRYGIIQDSNGLCYARARHFSPELGRFLTKDPLSGNDSDSQSINRYIYALNNPLRFVDPSGLSAREGRYQYNPYAAEAAYWETFNNETKWMVPYLRFFEGAGVVAGYTLDVLTLGESALARSALRKAALDGPSLARRLGNAGENAANIIKNTERIPSLTGTANYRIPDVLDRAVGVIGEVKNVQNLSYTSQIRDFVSYGQQAGLRFELIVRPTTQITAPLQEAVSQGNIFLRFLPTP
jgi:RHS repeat-associated protein